MKVKVEVVKLHLWWTVAWVGASWKNRCATLQSGNATNWREGISKTWGKVMFADMGSENIVSANKAFVARLF